MKRNVIVIVSIFSLSLIVPLLTDGRAWADGAAQPGGTSYGSGSVPICSAEYSGIHQPTCEVNGGGKSWRIYRVRGNGLSDLNNFTVPSGQKKWKVVQGSYGGKDVTGSKGVLSDCVKNDVPYIVIFGLNRVVVSGATPEFYVSLSREKPGGECGKNRGCYYKWNHYNELVKNISTPPYNSKIANNTFYDGQIVSKDLAKKLYTDAGLKSSLSYTKVGAFCAWDTKPPEYTLTAYAREYDGSSNPLLNNGKPIDDDSYNANESASVSNMHFAKPDGYSWFKWDVGGSICPNETDSECENDSMPAKSTSVAAYYLRDKFEGRTLVSGAGTGDTGFVKTNKSVTVELDNCDNGCTVKFDHQMKRTQGVGASSYSISRVSNLSSAASGNMGSGSFSQTGPASVRDSGDITLYSGNVVCETLTFQPQTIAGSSTAYSQVCVIAKAPAQVGSFIDAQVRDQDSADTYHSWQHEIYGKPGDKIEFKSWYTPTVQAMANRVVNIINNTDVGSKALKEHDGWNNGYDVNSNIDALKYQKQGTIGDTTTLSGENSHNAVSSNAGSYIYEKARTNGLIKKVPFSVSFGVTAAASPKITATVVWDEKSGTAYARIPYNFVNSATVDTSEDTLLYAGESKDIESSIIVHPKANSMTMKDGDKEYATKIGGQVNYRYIVYTPGDINNLPAARKVDGDRDIDDFCNYFQTALNCTTSAVRGSKSDVVANNDYTKENKVTLNPISFVVDDTSAGSKRCVAVAVFPADSGTDGNYDDTEYKDSDGVSHWSISDSKCYTVAKRPNLQVLGGNIYSSGGIQTSLSMKKHLAGFNNYDAWTTSDNAYIFGSWGELGLINTNSVKGFASGAGLGYLKNDNGTTWPASVSNDLIQGDHPGGYLGKYDYCKLSLLTLANELCHNSGEIAGNIGTGSAVNGISNDRMSIQNLAESLRIESSPVTDAGGGITINDDAATYYDINNNAVINESIIPFNKTILIHATGNITVAGNINYQQIPYDNILNTPKLVIYSDDTIMINCGVNRIDALLVAKTVNTCDNGNDTNSAINSNQLFIYGAVIANELKANRTYGAATGVNSMVSAEIIDFDPTLYLWEGTNNDADETGSSDDDSEKNLNLESVYLRELAPRL
ncbi:hypothetical protein IJI28_01205 [Candidatus Saccharibacteria bacterium]|nr:hypothetical protein [Candidatus Saccharibacteria bacterium]